MIMSTTIQYKTKSIIQAILLAVVMLLSSPVPGAGEETLTVALTGKYPPFSFYDQTGELAGFDVDVSRKVADLMGVELRIVTTEWDGILAGLLAGKFDAIIGSMAITVERSKQVSFSTPYYVSGAQLFINSKDADEIKNLTDLEGRRVGVVLGETFEHFLTNNYPKINTVTYKSTIDIYQDMVNGRLDGFVTDRRVGGYQFKAAGKPFLPAGNLLYRERMGIPVIPENQELLAKINKALEEMKTSGFMTGLQQKWFGSAAFDSVAAHEGIGMSWQTIADRLVRGFGITILVAFLSLVIGFVLAVPAGVVLNGRASPLL
jgi:ABC-type amino acid transport substrate-binding protein